MSRLVVAVLALALAALPCTAAAQTVPGSMDLQGHVSTAGGQALTGKVTLTVMLFDDEVVPIPFYATEVFDVAVTGGRFSIRLPDVAQDLFATHPFAFVEFSVDGGTPLPRTAVSSVPYAFQAANAGRAASAAQADAAKHADAATKADSAASADAAAVARAVPSGSTAQRPPAPAEGTLRYNSESGVMEVFVAGARGCWMNVNTPPIGASFVQWAGVSEPGAIYPCTTWVSDLQGGEFIRAVGGRSNVAADGTLTGLAQSFATQSFALALTGGIKDAALSTSSALGSHDHGGTAATSSAGGSHTHSGTTDSNGGDHTHAVSLSTSTAGAHLHSVNLSSQHNHTAEYESDEGEERSVTDDGGNQTNVSDNIFHSRTITTSTATVTISGNTGSYPDHSHSVSGTTASSGASHAHAFTTSGADTAHVHQATIPGADLAHAHDAAHGHAHDLAVLATGLVTADETRPTNVAVRFWRRTW